MQGILRWDERAMLSLFLAFRDTHVDVYFLATTTSSVDACPTPTMGLHPPSRTYQTLPPVTSVLHCLGYLALEDRQTHPNLV